MSVAFPAGGGTVIVERLIAERLTALWCQQVIVDNRGGAGGVIGTEIAARSAPDGYTIFMATLGNMSINSPLYKMNVDPSKALAHISTVVDVHTVLVANPKPPVHNETELIALTRQKTGPINYYSSGVGGPPHSEGDCFNTTNDV